jgi:hypothetical protein
MTDTTKKAMTLEQVRDWHLHQLNTLKDSWQPYIHHKACADAIDAHLAAQREAVLYVDPKLLKSIAVEIECSPIRLSDQQIPLYTAPPIPAQREGEPVAWRYRPENMPNENWLTTTSLAASRLSKVSGMDVEPLYTAPPLPRAVTDELEKIAITAAEKWANDNGFVGYMCPTGYVRAALEAALSEKGLGAYIPSPAKEK